jgi:PHD/YefM family antitoxin component YafN of YafNO toxin-antitoxin module
MPNIRPSAYLRNNYNEVSEFCHSKMEPVFITKNGHGDLAVMSIEAYEKFCGRYELYHLLDEAVKAEEDGDFMDYDNFIADLRKEMA